MFLWLRRPMCGMALPFRHALPIHPARGCAPIGLKPSIFSMNRHGKAEPFRTSGGAAAFVPIQHGLIEGFNGLVESNVFPAHAVLRPEAVADER